MQPNGALPDRCKRAGLFKALSVALMTASMMAVGLAPQGDLQAREVNASDTVAVIDLPREARETYRLVVTGGPFPYDKDGSVFGNRERNLPRERRGFYREYTVSTPGARNRGARRIVCGGQEVKSPEVCFYTQDHYASFRRIAP